MFLDLHCFVIVHRLDDDENTNMNGSECRVRLFYALQCYVEYEYVHEKGLLIKDINSGSKHGRELILETGIQANSSWFVQRINGKHIGKYSKEAADDILDKSSAENGYDILLKKE